MDDPSRVKRALGHALPESVTTADPHEDLARAHTAARARSRRRFRAGLGALALTLVAAVGALPPGTTSWSATGIGRSTLPVMLATLSKGGHLRVGMEDVLTLAKGVPVLHNDQLVARAVELGRLAQRIPASPAETRALLGVS